MFRTFLLGAALSLAACNANAEPENSPEAAPAEAAVAVATEPATKSPVEEAENKRELQAFQDSVEKAMGDIPPELREDFQIAFNCEIERNNASPQPKEIDASTIRDLTAQLKAGKDLGC